MNKRLSAGLAVAFALTVASSASAQTWAPAASATVHPGVQTYTNGGQCTANCIYTSGSDIYIGQAAHCSSTGALAPIVASNGVSDLASSLAYARSHGGPDATLAKGTEAFTGSLVG